MPHIINKKGSYSNPDALANVMHYITRTRNNDIGNDLYSYGVVGADYSKGIDWVIAQFLKTEEIYNIEGRGGRRVFHEVFSVSDIEMAKYEIAGVSQDKIYMALDYAARRVCNDYFAMGFQCVYAVHIHKNPHIHFAINAINFMTGYKWKARKPDIWQRDRAIQEYISECISTTCPVNSIQELIDACQ